MPMGVWLSTVFAGTHVGFRSFKTWWRKCEHCLFVERTVRSGFNPVLKIGNSWSGFDHLVMGSRSLLFVFSELGLGSVGFLLDDIELGSDLTTNCL